MLKIIYLFFSLIYVFFLPGWILTLLFSKPAAGISRFFLGLGLSIIIIPLLSFSAAMLLGTFVNPALILSLATLINAPGLLIILRQRFKN